MPKFSIDLDNVTNTVLKKSFKLSEVKDKIQKIGFDIVRFKDGNPEELWQIQSAEDGSEYVVALYNDEEKVVTASMKPHWSAVVRNNELHIFYKKDFLCKIASSKLGFTNEDLSLAKRYLPNKLAENKNLVKALFKDLDEQTCKNILSKYPELA